MKTITGNTIRKPYSQLGKAVENYAQAVATVGFTINALPIPSPTNPRQSIKNKTGLFRSDNGECLEIHSEKFAFVQPADSLMVLEKARQVVNGQWQTVQVNKGGRMICGFIGVENEFIVPKRGDVISFGLGHKDFFDGKGLEEFFLYSNNLSCDNGMVSSKAVMSFKNKHIGDIKDRVKAVEGRLQYQFVLAVNDMKEKITALDAKPMALNEVTRFAEILFPSDLVGDEIPTRTLNMRESIISGFTRGTGNQGRTAWDAFNSVTEFLDWGSTFRETEFSRDENRFESLLMGKAMGTRERALELLLN